MDFILTTFSPAMFGDHASIDIKKIPLRDAMDLVDASTKIVATRVSHEALARNTFPAAGEVARFVTVQPGQRALVLNYRGPPIPDSGETPPDGQVVVYLVEAFEPEAA